MRVPWRSLISHTGFAAAAALLTAAVLVHPAPPAAKSAATRTHTVDPLPEAAVSEAIEEYVVDLPDDGQEWYTTVIVHPDWQNTGERRIVAMFDADPALKLLKQQTKFHVMSTDSQWYREIMAPYVGKAPAILLQQANGKLVFKRSGDSLLREEAHDISRAMRKSVKDCVGPNCPWRPRPPAPKPKPKPLPDVGPKPDVKPAPDGKKKKSPLLALLAALAGGIGGVASQWRKDG